MVEIYTDGCCLNNPGTGSWAFVKIKDSKTVTDSGAYKEATNQQMELKAAVMALESLEEATEVTLYSDSKYVVDGITKWIHKWMNRNWRTSTGTQVANIELWKELYKLTYEKGHIITWMWVKGHNGNYYNELANNIAQDTAEQLKYSQ